MEAEKLEEPGFWKVIPLRKFREKDQVTFSGVPMEEFGKGLQGVDHVEHRANAQSPGFVGGHQRVVHAPSPTG